MLRVRTGMSWALLLLMPTATSGSPTPAADPTPDGDGGMHKCSDLKAFYKSESCCGNPDQDLSPLPPSPAPTPCPACPYNFNKPACEDAEPQAPRDLSTGATGSRIPKAATLNAAQAEMLPLTNVHYHLGAEHKSDAYFDTTDTEAYDGTNSGRRLSADPRPGFMCSNDGLTAEQLAPYTFVHCTGDTVQVGKSYEVHYVHSSAGTGHDEGVPDDADLDQIDLMADGLGQAANGRGMLNPMVVVQGQVYHIVQGAPPVDDLLHGWSVVAHNNSVMYPGSTTGPSHTNSVCSPYAITWHVDLDCHRVPPESWDKLCQDKSTLYGLVGDLAPHGSREILDPRWVVPTEYVVPLS